MYKIKNKLYADAGYVLKWKHMISFSFVDVDPAEVNEIKIDLENIKRNGCFIVYSDIMKELITGTSYKDWKTKWVNKQFPNDDQIAIMLNKDDSEEDLLLFNKMQEWRVWSGKVSKKIVDVISNE